MIFIKNKYYKWYQNIITAAKSQTRVKSKNHYYEKHHILPQSLNGDNSKENLVLLTAREHFICHYLLCKMLPENSDHWYSMVKAFNMMKGSSTHHNRYFNSYLYEYARKNLSNTMSHSQSGIKNSQSGTCWLSHSWIENLQIKIPKNSIEDYISQGWYGPAAQKYRKLLSWENKNPMSSTNGKITYRQKRSLKTKCHFCGDYKNECSCELKHKSTQILPNLNKYFGLQLTNLGTQQFINDWKECKNRIQQLYNKIGLTELIKLIDYKAVKLLLKNLDIIKIIRKSNINKAIFKYLYKIQLPNNSIIETTNKKQFLIDNNLSRCITDKQLEKKGYKILSQELIKKGL